MRKSHSKDYDQKYMSGGMVQDKPMPKMKSGGKVRGCGMAKKGVRKAKMR